MKKKLNAGTIAGLVILSIASVILIIVIVWSCTTGYTDKEVGDFNVRLYWNRCEILGTTKQGNDQRFLVIPKEIEGREVTQLGATQEIVVNLFGSLGIARPEITSDKIERVYFESELSAYPASLSKCSKLKKIIFVGGEAHFLNKSSEMRVHFPREVFANDGGNQDLQTWFHTVPANVSYYYNYASTEKEGFYKNYYWIDDYDYGSKIEYIPKDPTRGGYTFGGWYKEPQCINKWNFESDTLPEIDTNKVNQVNKDAYYYQETILYAKWSKK